jgi:hypothetical protein
MFSSVGLKISFSRPMGLLDLVVWICFLNYLEWSTNTMCSWTLMLSWNKVWQISNKMAYQNDVFPVPKVRRKRLFVVLKALNRSSPQTLNLSWGTSCCLCARCPKRREWGREAREYVTTAPSTRPPQIFP